MLGSAEADGEVLAVKRSGQVILHTSCRSCVSASSGFQAGNNRLSACRGRPVRKASVARVVAVVEGRCYKAN